MRLWDKFKLTTDFCHYFCLGDCRQNEVDIEVEGNSESSQSKTWNSTNC